MNKFFVWCSGADVRTVLRCESSEQNKYINIGMVVFFVALLASLSATFFVTYAFDQSTDPSIQLPYAIVGLLWGLVIISLDRSIVATINKEDPIKTQLIRASPRFVIAIFIGLVISTPLEMKIFSKEIKEKVREMIYNENKKGSSDLLKSNEDFLSAKTLELKSLHEEKTFAYERFRSEIGGATTGWKGYGPKAKDFELKYDQVEKAYNAKKMEVDSARQGLKDLRQSLGTVDSITDEEIAKLAGVEMRVQALYSLNYFHFIITLLFILCETLPMIVKLMSDKGNYEKFSRDQKMLYESMVIEDYKNKKDRADALEKIKIEKENAQINFKNVIETKLKEEILLELAKVQKEMATGRIEHFRKKTLDSLYEINNSNKSESGMTGAVEIIGGINDGNSRGYENHQNVSQSKIEVDPESAFIKDKDLEEILWSGDFEGVPSKLAFHSDNKEEQKKLSLKKGVNDIRVAVWKYDKNGKIALTLNGKKNIYQYQVFGNLLKLKNNKESLEFESTQTRNRD